MMRNLRRRAKPVLVFALSFCLAWTAQAQNATVRGKVIASSDGAALPGVNVLVKGTSNGTTTGTDGEYTITFSEKNPVLVFSFIGFTTQEITIDAQTQVDVKMQEDVTSLSEVIVTALGVPKEAKKIGYATSTVQGDQMNLARETNVAMSLEGRVAGLIVKGTSSGPGGTAKILLRGVSNMGGNGPLFVINGIPMDNTQRGSAGEWGGSDGGDGISNLNPDDIETMTVLKGQSASALYGARASGGVIMITTKKGKKNDFTVEYNSNYMADQAINYTDFQYQYGQGQYGNKPTTAQDAQLSSRLSWGAALDGSQVVQYDGKTYAYSAQKDNIKNFYQTGHSFTNTVSVSKGGENGSVRLSLSKLDNASIVPNSGLERYTFNLNVDQKITQKLSVNLVANYIDDFNKNKAYLSDGPLNPNNGLYLATNIDERILSPGYNPATGVEVRYGDDEYVTNPYFAVNQNVNNVGRKRLISSISSRYDFTSWLYAQGRVGYDIRNDYNFSVTPWGTAYTSGFKGGLNDLSRGQSFELNTDGLLGVNKDIASNFHLDALLGINFRKNQTESIGVNGGPFILPYLYTPTNVLNYGRSYSFSKREVFSSYYSIDMNYKGIVTLSTTGRYDDYSTLYPNKETSIFTPSVSTGLIFSELLDLPKLSYGKFRASWANTSGEPGSPYSTQLYYNLGNPLNGTPLGYFNNTAPNNLLKPFRLTEIELGTELKFFENRLGIDFAWFTRTSHDEIMNANFPQESKFTQGYIPTGSVRNTGIELQITGGIIRTPNFSWNITTNLTSIKNTILETDNNGNNVALGQNRGTLGNAITAYVKGYSGPQILAYDYKRDASGNIVVDGSGLPEKGELIKMGTVMPTLFGGLNNEFKYKGITLAFLIDYNFGNKVLSGTEYYSILRGLNKNTLPGRETGITTGVTESGAANTVKAAAQDYYRAVAQQVTSSSVVSGDFIKLRQLTLGYSVPTSLLGNVPTIRTITLSFVARNLGFLMRSASNIDPESNFGSTVNYLGIEGANLPSQRSYGFNLNFTFK